MESFKIAKILATFVLFYSFGSRWLFSHSALPTVHNMLLLLNFLPITTFLILVHLFLSAFLFFLHFRTHEAAESPTTAYKLPPRTAARCTRCFIPRHVACLSLECKIQHKLASQLWHAFAERLEYDTLSASLRRATSQTVAVPSHFE